MMRSLTGILFGLSLAAPALAGVKVAAPETGAYNATYLATWQLPTPEETLSALESYEAKYGKRVDVVTIHGDLANGFVFPSATAIALYDRGTIPLVRVAPRADYAHFTNAKDPKFDLMKIINGEFDEEFKAYFRSIGALRGADGEEVPVMMVFGPEVNGSWMRWNGAYYGGGNKTGYGDPEWPDGPEIFRDAYRHVIDLARSVCTYNITWVLHVDTHGTRVEWNAFEYYYAGDDYIDWVGLSVWGPQNQEEALVDYVPFDTYLEAEMSGKTPSAYKDMFRIGACKPKAILEMATMEHPYLPNAKQEWIAGAYDNIKRRYLFDMVTWWNEDPWETKGGADNNMWPDSTPQAENEFKRQIRDDFYGRKPVLTRSETKQCQ